MPLSNSDKTLGVLICILLAFAALILSGFVFEPVSIRKAWAQYKKKTNVLAHKAALKKAAQADVARLIDGFPKNPDVSSLKNNRAFMDVSLICRGETFFACNKVLRRSSVLDMMLTRLGTSSPRPPLVLKVAEDIDESTFLLMLDYLYSWKAPVFPSVDAAQRLLHAADLYNLSHLQFMCTIFLLSSCAMTVENVAYTLALAEQHQAIALKEEALEFAARNSAAVLKTEGWQHVLKYTPSVVNDLCSKLAR